MDLRGSSNGLRTDFRKSDMAYIASLHQIGDRSDVECPLMTDCVEKTLQASALAVC
jgi:hypothetical protein